MIAHAKVGSNTREIYYDLKRVGPTGSQPRTTLGRVPETETTLHAATMRPKTHWSGMVGADPTKKSGAERENTTHELSIRNKPSECTKPLMISPHSGPQFCAVQDVPFWGTNSCQMA